MKLDLTKKSHKFLIFMLLAVPMILITMFYTLWINVESEDTTKNEKIKDSAPADPSSTQKEEPIKEPKKEVSPAITEEDKSTSKLVAEKFAMAYGNYDSKNPSIFVQNSLPCLTEGLHAQWEEKPPRKPLALSKSTVKKLETFPIDGGDKYTIGWNVILTEDTINALGDKVLQEEWLWILLVKENGDWKVKGVEVNNG